MQADLGIDWIQSRSVLPSRYISNCVVGIQIAPSGVLRVADAAAIEQGSGGELIAADFGRVRLRNLSGKSIIVLHFFRVDGDSIASRVRIISEQRRANAAPLRKGRVGSGGATRRETGVTGGCQCGLFRRVRLIDRIAERVGV